MDGAERRLRFDLGAQPGPRSDAGDGQVRSVAAAQHVEVQVHADRGRARRRRRHERAGPAQSELLRVEHGQDHGVARRSLVQDPRDGQEGGDARRVVIRAGVEDIAPDAEVVVVRGHDQRRPRRRSGDQGQHVRAVHVRAHRAVAAPEGLHARVAEVERVLVAAAERRRCLVAQALDDVGTCPRVALGARAAALHVRGGQQAHVLDEPARVDVRRLARAAGEGRAKPPRLEEGGGTHPGREEGEDGQAP